jgi:ADP-ribose pyrophosphatase
LLAARHVVGADISIVTPGPGTVGTNTRWGFGGVRQGEATNAVHSLGGRPVAVVRASSADKRERHRGISHHTRTVFSRVALAPFAAAWPAPTGHSNQTDWDELCAETGEGLRGFIIEGAEMALERFERDWRTWTSMGRNREDDPLFFEAAAAAGILARRLLGGDSNLSTQDKRETPVHRDTIYTGKTLSLHRDTVTLPNGKEGFREIVEHRGSVVIAAVGDGVVYFVRQYRHAVGEFLLELAAGTMEAGEAPIECARRETAEELGLAAGSLESLCEGYVSPGYTSELQHFYLAQGLSPVQAECDDDEFLDVVSMPWADAMAALDKGEFRDSKTVVGLLMAARRLNLK